jgi:type VI secretion system protein ImpG
MGRHPYFLDYLRFLNEGGGAMARTYPRIADHLAERSLDPDVELLLRGIAFLSSKTAERLELSLDEITELTFDLLFPHYLCPIPANAIVEFAPRQDAVPRIIKRGTEIQSKATLGTRCRFITAYDVPWFGMSIQQVDWRQSTRQARLDLTLSLGHWLEHAPEDRIRLYLYGEHLVSRTLFLALHTGVRRVEIGSERRSGGLVVESDWSDATTQISVNPVRMGVSESLLDQPEGSFAGFRVLQEYFAFPEKLLFVDIVGLRAALKQRGSMPGSISIRFELDIEMGELVVGRQHLRLHCTPVTNLFAHTADPITRRAARTDYPLRPAGIYLHNELYRVLDVKGHSRGQVVDYRPLFELELIDRPFCQLFRRRRHNETFVHIALDDGPRLAPRKQVVLVDILATNGKLPLALMLGDICVPPAFLNGQFTCRNITPVSQPIDAPTGSELVRRLIAHIALGQRDMATRDALCDALDLYDFGAFRDEQRAHTHRLLLEGVLEVETKPSQALHHGVPILGRESSILLSQQSFDTSGDLHLFGMVLNEYLALQATINQYSSVRIRNSQTLREFRWPKRAGPHLLSAS